MQKLMTRPRAIDSRSSLKEIDTLAPPSNSYEVETIRNSCMFQNLTLDDSIKANQRTEYETYLDFALKSLEPQLLALNGNKIEVTTEILIKELRFWEKEEFIWPNVLFTPEGGITFFWKVGSENLKFTRLLSGRYVINYWNDESILKRKNKTHQDQDLFLQKDLPVIYKNMIDKVNKAGINWKSALTGGAF